jgi:hypothetical protein
VVGASVVALQWLIGSEAERPADREDLPEPKAPAAPGFQPDTLGDHEAETPAPPADPLTLDDRAVALLTRWLKERRPKISKRSLATALGCHHSSLDDCPTFQQLWETSKESPREGYRDAKTGNIETADDD